MMVHMSLGGGVTNSVCLSLSYGQLINAEIAAHLIGALQTWLLDWPLYTKSWLREIANLE